METPGCKTEEIIAQHEAHVHKGSVVVGAGSLKCPDIGGKYLRNEPYLPDPRVLHHLGYVIIDKPVSKGVAINCERYCDDNHDQDQSGFLQRRPL